MDLSKFKLLIWRNYRLRRFRWILTLIEFIFPILFIYGAVKLTSLVSLRLSTVTDDSTMRKNETIYTATIRSVFISKVRKLTIMYAPTNPVVDEFMSSFDDKQFAAVEKFTNEAELEIAMRNISAERYSRRIVYGIFFKNIPSNGTFPDKLNYELRLRNSNNMWMTRELYPPIETTGPYVDHRYYITAFSPLQLIINEQFIKLKTGQNPSELEFEWFPFPEYIRNEGLRSYISIVVESLVVMMFLIVSQMWINDITEEKDTGVKGLMKMTGVNEWTIWLSWFVHAFVVSFISFTIVSIILTYPIFNDPGSEAIRFVQPSIIWAFIMLYCIASIFFCFTFLSIFHKAVIASMVFSIVSVLLTFGVFWLLNHAAQHPIVKFITLTPVGAFALGFTKIRYYEMQGIEYTWSSIGTSEITENSVSLLFCMLMLVFDTFLYFFLTYYIASINPGRFGVRKSPFFLFQRLISRFSNDDSQPLRNFNDIAESEFIESPPSNVEATIQIKDLHKHYGSVYANRGVNLKVYSGELTALLGHNGAGKTTTMSIMTGLTSPSAGTIHYKNMDIFKNMTDFRRKLGVCTQENRTMPYLTVMEHLIFFGQLKGVSREAAETEANEYLNMMEMQSKSNSFVKELSGGMTRKLCLSIALMGKAEVLLLDEPTSGLDVQSRRKIWDLLSDMRGERTIIFTTHYMEEADALGDRIAIMNHGVIVCHGTPIFLKKAYNTGYELTIAKNADSSDSIIQVIKNVLPDVSREFEIGKEVVFKLPLTETDKFPLLFRNLESEMTRLGIENMSVAANTMEHVFLKVCGISAHDVKAARNTTVTDSIRESNSIRYVRGAALFAQQIRALFKKKFLYTMRNWFTVLVLVILPTLVCILGLRDEINSSPEPPIELSMTIYPGATVVLKNDRADSNFTKHLSEYVAERRGVLENANISPIERALLKSAAGDLFKYNKNYISAFELNATTTKILTNPPLIHSLPIAITTYSNVLLRVLTNSRRYAIETINYPVPRGYENSDVKQLCEVPEASVSFFIFWSFAVIFNGIYLSANFVVFVNTERIEGFQHVQFMSNVSPLVYWFSTLLFDVVFFLFATTAQILLLKLFDDSDFLGFDDDSLGVFALIIVLYAICSLLFVYVAGYLSSSKEASLLLVINMICIMIGAIFWAMQKFLVLVAGSMDQWSMTYKMLFYIVEFVVMLVPSSNFTVLFIKLMFIFDDNTKCMHCSYALRPVCEAAFKKKNYLVYSSDENPDGLFPALFYWLFDIVLYSTILVIVNTRFCHYWNSLKNSIYGTDPDREDTGDSDVQQEYSKVQEYKKDTSKINRVTLLVDGLRKNYITSFKPFTAVNNVSFIVEPGECFVLLGANGAGKSTAFKILTAELVPTMGDAAIETIKLSTNKLQYLSMAGYCPQTNCFLAELTGRETLSMIAAMRGVSENGNRALVDKWITNMGLEEYQNKRCSTYSGGNKRKLCTAMSLIGDPRVVFLDEPTSGVDPVARRNLYEVMRQSREAGQAVILTSHSMEECETLCNRLTIMVSGVMKCIGTAHHLKTRYAQGFSVLIKINDIPNITDEMTSLKKLMLETFGENHCILKDEHRGLLYYQIKNTSLLWSTLFEKMEALKKHHRELVDEYVLTETTLEEVFISFAK